jgi:uncharacterized membrane protein YbhN (UPF0104 family)
MRQVLSVVAKVAISLALLYVALGKTDFSGMGARLIQLDAMWIAAAIAMTLLQITFQSVRWHHIAAQCGATLPVPRAVRFSIIASFFNQVLPSTVGGDTMRVWLTARTGAGWQQATYSVLLDRFIGLLALALLVVACLPWSLTLVHNEHGRLVLVLLGAASLGAALGFVALGYVAWAPLLRWWPMRHLVQMAATVRNVFTSAHLLPLIMGLSFAVHLLTVATGWCAAMAIASPFRFADALLLVPPVILISMVPVSIAGWGVRESALMVAFTYAGLPEGDGLLVSLLYGAAMFAVGLIGGVVWLLSSDRAAKPANEEANT